jgi:hypothetical protein
MSGLLESTERNSTSGIDIIYEPEPEQEPANITYKSVSATPSTAEIGEELTVVITLENTGDLSVTEAVELNIDDEQIDGKTITVDGGTAETVDFTITRDTAGTFTLQAGDKTTTITIIEPEPDPPYNPPSPTPRPREDPDPEVRIETYSDLQCVNPVSEIEWGAIDAGFQQQATIYLKNEGGISLTLNLDSNNWTPLNVEDYMTLSWDYHGQAINPGEVREVTRARIVSPRSFLLHLFTALLLSSIWFKSSYAGFARAYLQSHTFPTSYWFSDSNIL